MSQSSALGSVVRIVHFVKTLSSPILLLFMLAFAVRTWLLHGTHGPASLGAYLGSLLLTTGIGILTWFIALGLAGLAKISERGKERFMVMSTLGALVPLPVFAVRESIGWRGPDSWLALTLPTAEGYLYIASIVVLIIPCLALLVALSTCISNFWLKSFIITRLGRLTALPLVYSLIMILVAVITNSLSLASNVQQIVDILLGIALPFLLAALFSTPYLLAQWYETHQQAQSVVGKVLSHSVMLLIIALYFCSLLIIYVHLS